MSNTGIIRKIDELGRIVIPKEIRKNLNIRNGEDIEISVDNDKIVLSKAIRLLNISDNIQKYLDSFKNYFKSIVLATDLKKVIASNDKSFINKEIDNNLLSVIDERKEINLLSINIYDKNYNVFVKPIIIGTDLMGSFILLCDNNIYEEDKLLLNIVNILLNELIY